jgi:pyrroline-5-carboxylate reductase
MLLKQLRLMGVRNEKLLVCDADPERAREAAELTGCAVLDLEGPAFCSADIWLLCAGPKAVLPLIHQLIPHLKSGDILVSFAAAVPLPAIEAYLPEGVSAVRVMPNMPSLIGKGINPVCFSNDAPDDARTVILDLLRQLGDGIQVKDDQMNWCVGLSGAAMRSVLPAIEGLVRAGVEAGLAEKDARRVAAQVFLGTASMVKETSLSFAEIKALTPMETLDEALVEDLYYQSVVRAKEKMDRLQEKILSESSR